MKKHGVIMLLLVCFLISSPAVAADQRFANVKGMELSQITGDYFVSLEEITTINSQEEVTIIAVDCETVCLYRADPPLYVSDDPANLAGCQGIIINNLYMESSLYFGTIRTLYNNQSLLVGGADLFCFLKHSRSLI